VVEQEQTPRPGDEQHQVGIARTGLTVELRGRLPNRGLVLGRADNHSLVWLAQSFEDLRPQCNRTGVPGDHWNLKLLGETVGQKQGVWAHRGIGARCTGGQRANQSEDLEGVKKPISRGRSRLGLEAQWAYSSGRPRLAPHERMSIPPESPEGTRKGCKVRVRTNEEENGARSRQQIPRTTLRGRPRPAHECR